MPRSKKMTVNQPSRANMEWITGSDGIKRRNLAFKGKNDEDTSASSTPNPTTIMMEMLRQRHDEGVIQYSFLDEFKELEDEFNSSFSGVPKRFFTTDIRGKNLYYLPDDMDASLHDFEEWMNIDLPSCETPEDIRRLLSDKIDHDYGSRGFIRFMVLGSNNCDLYGRITTAMSSPKDETISDEDIMAMMENMGFDNVCAIDGAKGGWERSFHGSMNGQDFCIKQGGKRLAPFTRRRWRRHVPEFESDVFICLDVRNLVGAERLRHKTGRNVFDQLTDTSGNKFSSSMSALHTLVDVENAQIEGQNFLAQKKHVTEHSGKIATAWMDKKNPDKTHQRLMDTHHLGHSFRKVEIDNDVDPKEFYDFQNAINQTVAKLPRIPGTVQPELRIRKLGKHRANGIFFPHNNTVCVDVHTSEAFVHEMGHYYDFMVKNNASLSKEFRGITKRYGRGLNKSKIPSGKLSYYMTPTEIFARGFEMYAHEKLGVNNRLVKPDNFTRFDYEPFSSNSEFKRDIYAFFDKTFGKEQ